MKIPRRVCALVAGLILAAGFVISTPTSVQAEECPTPIEGTNDYDFSCLGGGGAATDPDPGGTGQEPTCELSQEYGDFCEGTSACWGNNPAANDEEDVADKLGEKPDDPEAHVAYKKCRRTDGSTYDKWYWATAGDGPTLNELAQRAYGALNFPTFAPTFNPPGRTIVNLDTWWWADGAATTELISSSALGVRALAAPDHMEVDPGDGSGAFNCNFSTAKADDCTYTYRRASNRGSAEAPDGTPAYPARMRLVWNVRFERNGAPITVTGLPAVFSSTWNNVAVPVREVQTVVQPRADSN